MYKNLNKTQRISNTNLKEYKAAQRFEEFSIGFSILPKNIETNSY